jgi:hypothetical protein
MRDPGACPHVRALRLPHPRPWRRSARRWGQRSTLAADLDGVAVALSRTDEALRFGAYELGWGVLHPLTLIYALSGTAMISSTLRVPKL